MIMVEITIVISLWYYQPCMIETKYTNFRDYYLVKKGKTPTPSKYPTTYVSKITWCSLFGQGEMELVMSSVYDLISCHVSSCFRSR